MRFRYVAVEGSIGVGKTTLATALAQHWGARLVLEQPAANPYLERYYAAMEGLAAHGRTVDTAAPHQPDIDTTTATSTATATATTTATATVWRRNPLALQTQLNFLFQRIDQLAALGQPGMFDRGVVSDFLFAKDAIFAALTLSDDDLALYRQIHRQHAVRAAPPDLVIWLHAEPDTLLTRVRRRGRAMERSITEDYLRSLNEAYQRHFASHDGHHGSPPVLAVNTEAFHPAEGGPDSADLRRLLDRIERFQGPFEYFDPPDRPGRAADGLSALLPPRGTTGRIDH